MKRSRTKTRSPRPPRSHAQRLELRAARLGAQLQHIALALRHSGRVDEDVSCVGHGAPPRRPRRGPEHAIRNARDLFRQIRCARILLRHLPRVEATDEIATALAMVDSAVSQCDVPAEMALSDGRRAEAVGIIRDRLADAYDLCGARLLEAEARVTIGLRTTGRGGEPARDLAPLTRQAARLWAEVEKAMGETGGVPIFDDLEMRLGMSRKTVAKYMRELRDKGYLPHKADRSRS